MRIAKKWMQSNGFFIFLSGIISSVAFIYVSHLWKADWNYLWVGSQGDALLESMAVNNLIETGTRNLSNRLGGAWGQELYSFPVSDALNYFIMRIISLFSSNPFWVVNVFYFMTYPLAAMSGTFALIKLKKDRFLAVGGGVLYSFMSYHFFRNQNHLLLSAYFMVPLAILMAFSIIEKDWFWRQENKKWQWSKNLKWGILISLLISSTGIYYAFFACFFYCLAGLYSFLKTKSWNNKVTACVIFISTILIGGVANQLRTIIYLIQGGALYPLNRGLGSADFYGLKIFDLFLPNFNHQIDYLRHLMRIYQNISPLTNENFTVSMGVLASIGLVILFLTPIMQWKQKTEATEKWKIGSYFCLSAILLATIGGGGSMLSWTVLKQIRAYNRISVCIFFLALFSVISFIEVLLQLKWVNPQLKLIAKICLIFVFLMALFDQTPLMSRLNFAENKDKDISYENFITQIEKRIPEGSLIFQLPYMVFPEPDDVHTVGPYDHVQGYLVSENLKWSYGAMMASPGDLWYKKASHLKGEALIEELVKHNYKGIYVDLRRADFRENNPDIKRQVEEILALVNTDLIFSQDENLYFIPLIPQ